MTLGYRFEFSIYSLIHAVLEKVGFTFAQTAAISFLLPICILFPISFNLFVLFIYYSTAVTPPSFPRCILPGSNLFSVESLLVVAIFCLLFLPPCTPYAFPSLDPGAHALRNEIRNTPCRNTLLNTF
jgi:hypothetical protein